MVPDRFRNVAQNLRNEYLPAQQLHTSVLADATCHKRHCSVYQYGIAERRGLRDIANRAGPPNTRAPPFPRCAAFEMSAEERLTWRALPPRCFGAEAGLGSGRSGWRTSTQNGPRIRLLCTAATASLWCGNLPLAICRDPANPTRRRHQPSRVMDRPSAAGFPTLAAAVRNTGERNRWRSSKHRTWSRDSGP
jgi:hypothetical protein